jgi:hypothetical protein
MCIINFRKKPLKKIPQKKSVKFLSLNFFAKYLKFLNIFVFSKFFFEQVSS